MNIINIIIESILMLVGVACIIYSYRSGNKISKIPHTRREVVQATELATESTFFAILWAVATVSALIIAVWG